MSHPSSSNPSAGSMTAQHSHAGNPLSTPTYSLSAASVEKSQLPGPMSKRFPHYPVPAAVLGRLAVDRAHQGRGLGGLSLLDAIRRVVRASETIAVYAIFVDAKTDRAKDVYERYGVISFAGARRRLYLPLQTFNAPRHDDLLA